MASIVKPLSLYADESEMLKEIANKEFDGNESMAARKAIRWYHDYQYAPKIDTPPAPRKAKRRTAEQPASASN